PWSPPRSLAGPPSLWVLIGLLLRFAVVPRPVRRAAASSIERFPWNVDVSSEAHTFHNGKYFPGERRRSRDPRAARRGRLMTCGAACVSERAEHPRVAERVRLDPREVQELRSALVPRVEELDVDLGR